MNNTDLNTVMKPPNDLITSNSQGKQGNLKNLNLI